MTRALDGVQMAVLSNRFEGIVRAMINTLFRTSRSGVLATARDLSCAIVTADCEFLAAAESLPIHVIGADLAAKALLELHPELSRGDAFINNSPYHGNTHPADHSILVPVIDEEGQHHFTVYTKAHVADCGASRPTTYSSTARDVYDDGTLIFPHVRIQRDYRDCEDVIRMCKLRIRVPEDWWGDYLAQIGAARIGERLVLELGREYGWETLREYAHRWFDYSEQRMIEAVRDLPSGRVTARTAHDPFPGIPEGIPLAVTVDVRSDEGLVEVDLRDNPDCQPCGFNMTEAYAKGAALIAVFNSLRTPVPPNAGSFRRIRIHVRENCVAGIPRHPACCSSGMSPTDRVINAIQRAIAELGEGVGMAEAGVNMPPAFGVLSGRDPRTGGTPFINQVILPSVTGGAGTPVADGWLLNAVPVVSGSMLRDSVEMDERRHPIRIEAQHIIPDSEGAGRFRGAPGAYVEYGPIDCTIEDMYTSDGTVTPALGVRGGLPGAKATQYKRETSGALVEASPERATLGPGETIVSISCGGGGYGPPAERDPERVRHDVVEGWITRERAEAVYGVVLTGAGEVDAEATARLRAGMAG